jgi:hypothetical protein
MTELLLRSDVRGDRLGLGDKIPERTRREPLAGAGLVLLVSRETRLNNIVINDQDRYKRAFRMSKTRSVLHPSWHTASAPMLFV